MAPDSRRLRTPDAADYLGLAESTLEHDRVSGKLGIPFIKIGPRVVVYDTRQLDEFLAARTATSTSQEVKSP